jgi:hypothetical protein
MRITFRRLGLHEVVANVDGKPAARLAHLRDRDEWYWYGVGPRPADAPPVNTTSTPASTLEACKAEVRAYLRARAATLASHAAEEAARRLGGAG